MVDIEQKKRVELAWLLQRGAPARVPRSGPAGEAVDCYVLEVPRNGQPYLMLSSIQGDVVEALEWDGTQFATPQQIALSTIQPDDVKVTHFYGLAELSFNGLNAAVHARRWKLPYFRLRLLQWWGRAAQWLFNRRDLKAGERLAVLREVVAAVGNSDQDAVDAFFLMTLRHGPQWARHPGWEQLRRALTRQLNGLADTGELRLDTGSQLFTPTGQAYKSLEESDDTDRRHRDNFRLQIAIGVLTLVGALMAAVQADVVKVPTLVDFTGGAKVDAAKSADTKP
jgi:hypothetical protein